MKSIYKDMNQTKDVRSVSLGVAQNSRSNNSTMSKYMSQSKKDRNGSPYQMMKDNEKEIKNLQMHLSPIQLQKRSANKLEMNFSAGQKHGAATLGSRIMSVDFAKGVVNEKKTSSFIENDAS